MKVRVPRKGAARFLLGPTGRILLLAAAGLTFAGACVFTYFYAHYARLIDEKIRVGTFANASKIFAAPESVGVGDALTPIDIASALRRSGYNESAGNPTGHFRLSPRSIEVFPGPDSYFDQEAGLIRFAGGRISQIVSLRDNTERSLYQLEPQLITNVSGTKREKRRLVKFHDIPKVMVNAVISAEDKRFFQHNGFDPIRIIKAAYIDVRQGRKDQGASTLSQQLARIFKDDMRKSWSRKAAEVVITLLIEQRLTKEEIFENYANEIYLGWRGAYQIHGFGEAAEVFFGKDLSQVTLPEAATISGIIQSPARFDPFRHPDEARKRRNIILTMMRQNDLIDDRDYALATESPMVVAQLATQTLEAPYFVDLVSDVMSQHFQEADIQTTAYRIYTPLDLRLQRAAAEAVRAGMQNVDEQIRRQRRFRGKTPPDAQVALVAIDPHSGEIKALVGGRNYGVSQLNHAQAKRQPGSIFKPFVYAAALDTALEGGPRTLTASTQVLDEPYEFQFDNQPPYKPRNFEDQYKGLVTYREALAHSLNVATVKVAEMVGYDKVVDMANRAGMNYDIQPTPAVALGAYEITPLEAAGAYTVFANHGEYVKPRFITRVRAAQGNTLYKDKPERRQAIDQRLAYVMTNLMEEVLNSGTAAGMKQRYNIDFPAAGKTGTSHDGWFAGYTTDLLCVVWVGFDDNRELNLEGAHSAAPIWAEFMKRALQYREYRAPKPFEVPGGIVSMVIDPDTGMQATSNCPHKRTEVYIAGSEPTTACTRHGGRLITNVTGWDTTPMAQTDTSDQPPAAGLDADASAAAGGARPDQRPARPRALPRKPAPAVPAAAPEQQKKGFWSRLLGVFK